MTEVQQIIDALQDLCEDSAVPKNIKLKMQEITKLLESSEESSIKINKALDELDVIATDSNLQAFTRTQIYNIISLLESVS